MKNILITGGAGFIGSHICVTLLEANYNIFVADSILKSKPIRVFNYGKMTRDFTYIDDVSESILRCSFKKPKAVNYFNRDETNPSTSKAPHIILNIGNSKSVNLLEFIEILENNLGKKAIKDFQPIQPGDVENTFADISKLKNWIDYSPKISIEKGINIFAKWYKDYYGYLKK